MTILVTIFIIGLSGIIAQIVILRELLVSFYGNELTVGIILANWVMLEAAGVFALGRWIDRAKNKLNIFIVSNILFALFLPACVYFSRVFKAIIGIPFAEAVALSTIFVSSFIIILPVAFLHGALFSCGVKVYSLVSARPERSIGRVYAWEALGTITGGITLAYLLIPLLNSFQIALAISFLNLFLAVNFISPNKIKYVAWGILLLLFGLFFFPAAGYLQKGSIEKQWQGQALLDYRNSNYANIAVTKRLEQYTYFYNGIPVITTPFPDKQFVEEFGNLPLLFHAKPKEVLVAGGGVGGLMSEILGHPIHQLDYVEIDPLIIKIVREHPTYLSEKELGDGRVNIVNTDPRIFIRRTNNLYDLILIGLSNQADLSSNRLFTQEFFALAKRKLEANGLLALWMPGSLTYLSREEKDLNSCVLNSLKSVYRYARVIPGDSNIFIASDSVEILQVNAGLISERLSQKHINRRFLIPDYLEYRLSKNWSDWFSRQMSSATSALNRDLQPVAVYETLKITNKKFSPGFSRVFEYLNYLNLKLIFFIIFLVAAVLILISKLRRSRKIPVFYAIFTTGFFGMLAALLLIFAYQVFYGCLYQKISVLTAVFMAGVAAGSMLVASGLSRIKNGRSLLIVLEGLLTVFSLALGAIFSGFGAVAPAGLAAVIYILLFFSGLLMGAEFPLAGRLYLEESSNKVGRASGALYASDLAGGFLAGILAGAAFLPLLGFWGTCMVMAGLKLSSLILLLFLRKAMI